MENTQIIEILKEVKYPGFSRDIVSFGIVKELSFDDGVVLIKIEVKSDNREHLKQINEDIKNILLKKDAINEVKILNASANASNEANGIENISQIKKIIAVASAKGGVGKSTVAVNLAASLSKNHKVGLLDLDIYGPSLPMTVGVQNQPQVNEDGKIYPIERFNMKLMSFGFISGNNSPAIWRGPMVARMTSQFFDDVLWGELDYLILDLPPGTGDIQLTLVQKIALTGALIVTTPQDLAIIDVKKGAEMFQKVNTPVLGIIENMTEFICPDTNKSYKIFKGNGANLLSKELDVPILAKIPIYPILSESADAGSPFVLDNDTSKISQEFNNISEFLDKVK
tara:strand:+ start:1030 stop:2049 length:1020 start_codon:yes stop_codon:yes gene_type:complete